MGRVARAAAVLGFLAVGLGGCFTAHDVLVGPEWTLSAFHGRPAVTAAGVTFGADGTFLMRTGCNAVSGTYHLEGNRILVDSDRSALEPCEEAEVKLQQDALLTVLHAAPAYAIESGTGSLRITGGGDAGLVFEAR